MKSSLIGNPSISFDFYERKKFNFQNTKFTNRCKLLSEVEANKKLKHEQETSEI